MSTAWPSRGMPMSLSVTATPANSSQVISRALRSTPAMRCRFASLSRTGWRSTESWTSKPRWRAPSSNAERRAGRVFSGYSATLPRRAISSGSRLDGICGEFYPRRRMRRRHPTLGGADTICYCMSCGEFMYAAPFAGRLNIAARCAALLLALGFLQACNSGEGTRETDPPTQNPPPPPPPPPPPTGEPSGLDARPSNTTCLAWDRPTGDDTISLTRYTNLSFSSPVAMLQDPGDNSRWFVVEQAGVVRTFPTSNLTTG